MERWLIELRDEVAEQKKDWSRKKKLRDKKNTKKKGRPRLSTNKIKTNPLYKELKEMRPNLLIQFNYTCQECGKIYYDNLKNLHIHHIKLISKGGNNDRNNLIALCKNPCHRDKHPNLADYLFK